MPHPDLTTIRHELHRRAELSGRESNTAEYLAEQLAACDPDELVTGLGGHGVAAVFAGGQAGPTVLLRSDIDALPLPDTDDLAYASRTEGVAHKCGHDGHMTMLLGLARRLSTHRPDRGRAVLLFQPAEETGAGARAVLDDPAFAALRPDRVLGIHNLPGFPLGAVVLREGPFAAASRGLTVRLRGASSHAAEPEAGRSPVPAATALANALTGLPQLGTALDDAAKVTVVGIHVGGPAFGTSPGDGRVMATLRAYHDEVVEGLAGRAETLARGLAEAHGLRCEISWSEDFPATVNDDDVAAAIAELARDRGLRLVRPEATFAWSEDFGHFTAAFPGALVGLGAGPDQPPLHHPDYDFPDDLLPLGVEFWQQALARLLAMEPPRDGGQ